MDDTYGEFQGTELDPAFDFDFEGDQQNDLIPILGFSAALAAVVGAILVLVGRMRKATPQERAQEIAQEMLDRASKEGKKGAKAMTRAAKAAKLGDLLDEALNRARDAADSVDVGDIASSVNKRARQAAKDMDLSSLLGDATEKARQAASNVDSKGLKKAVHNVRKQAESAASNVSTVAGGLDTSNPEKLLDSLKEKLVQAIDAVRSDLAPKAMDALQGELLPAAQDAAGAVARRVKEDVVPAAQDAVGKLREDVIPAAQERAGKLADDYEVGPKAQKAASSARKQASSLSGVMQGLAMSVVDKILQDFLPEAKKAGGKAVQSAREDVIPAAAQTAGDAAQRVREDVLPKVSEAASQAPDLLADLLKTAREKVEQALDTVGPVAADALDIGKSRASDAAEFGKHRAQNVAGNVRDTRDGVSGALSNAGKGVGNAVGGAVSATTYATRETTGVLFWLAMLGGMILLIFVPERDKQSEIWNNITQFLGEVREMWRDLQGSEYQLEAPGDNNTGTTQ